MLRPSRIVEQMRGIPLFVGKSASKCGVCGRPLTAHESVARGIGPVCVRKHYGPGAHPSGSPQSAHAGKRGGRKPLAELAKGKPTKVEQLPAEQSGIEISYTVEYADGTKALVKINKVGSAESELMAYEFSKSIGWDIVPETVLSPGEPGVSIQRWVNGETLGALADRAWLEGKDVEFDALVGLRRKNSRLVTMDNLLSNQDRHMDNVVMDEAGKQWAIDNNQAFGTRPIWGYDPLPRFGLRVTKDRAGLIDAAKDVRRWFKTPAYYEYVAKLEKTHGRAVARQFGLNVADLADWSRKAKVME